MAFGPAKGMGFEAFRKLVKKLEIVVIDGRGEVARAEAPPSWFNVPVFNIRVDLK